MNEEEREEKRERKTKREREEKRERKTKREREGGRHGNRGETGRNSMGRKFNPNAILHVEATVQQCYTSTVIKLSSILSHR